MWNIITNSFDYADDIIILTPTITVLKNLIKLCENYSVVYQIKFNYFKSNVITFNNTENNPNLKIVMNKPTIPDEMNVITWAMLFQIKN